MARAGHRGQRVQPVRILSSWYVPPPKHALLKPPVMEAKFCPACRRFEPRFAGDRKQTSERGAMTFTVRCQLANRDTRRPK